jgi:hypothetical protein
MLVKVARVRKALDVFQSTDVQKLGPNLIWLSSASLCFLRDLCDKHFVGFNGAHCHCAKTSKKVLITEVAEETEARRGKEKMGAPAVKGIIKHGFYPFLSPSIPGKQLVGVGRS